MSEIVDVTAALVALATLDAAVGGVRELAGERIYGEELPREYATPGVAPLYALVFRDSGSGALREEHFAYASQYRIDVWSYGPTPFEAARLRRRIQGLLKQMNRTVVTVGAGAEAVKVLLHSAIRTAGPITFRDPVTDWPIQVLTFEIAAADLAVAA